MQSFKHSKYDALGLPEKAGGLGVPGLLENIHNIDTSTSWYSQAISF